MDCITEKKDNVVILAAGDGKRMHAPCSKVLCTVSGKTMLEWVIDAAKATGIENVIVVYSAEDVKRLAEDAGCKAVLQDKRLGTGHAVMCAVDLLSENPEGSTLVLCGDAPFMDSETIESALNEHLRESNGVTVITAVLEDPSRYGRIVRNNGAVEKIVEYLDATEEERKIREINSGSYWFDTKQLLSALSQLKNNNSQGEYYLTDTLEIIKSSGRKVGAFAGRSSDIVLGANDPEGLLMLNKTAREKRINELLAAGVRFRCTDGITIGPDVEVEAGAEILEGCVLTGRSKICTGAVVGPNSMVHNTVIGSGTKFENSKSADSVIGRDCVIGPYVQLRPECSIGNEVKIGDFVEVKNSSIGDGTSVAHLTYIGDATVGSCCNFGCGTVFVNYDGVRKNRITIGDYCFIGCNTNLIAPVTLGDGAYTAAGVTVTRDIPAGALAIDRGNLIVREGWATRKLKNYIEKQNNRHKK